MSQFLMSFRVEMHNIYIIVITISSIAMILHKTISCIHIYICFLYNIYLLPVTIY